MLEWFRSGGVKWLFPTPLGAVMSPTASAVARNADPRRLWILRARSWVLVAMTLTGFVGGLVATCRYVADHPDALAAPLPVLLQGFSESCSNLVLGGSIAVIAWTLVAVGIRRMPHDA